jgi:hypothetical protein
MPVVPMQQILKHAFDNRYGVGDPDGEKCEVIDNRSAGRPVDCFRVSDLETVL